MKRVKLPSLRAAVEVATWRYGWCWWVAALALAGAATLEWYLTPAQTAELHRLRSNHGAAQVVAPPPAKDAVFERAAQASQIEAQLQAQGDFESQMRRVVDLAAKHGVVLRRGEYVAAGSNSGVGPTRTQVGLGVSARYPQFRAFVEDVLRQCPAVSLDRFSLKRDKVEQGQAEIQVTLSFWRAATTTEAPAAVAVVAKGKP